MPYSTNGSLVYRSACTSDRVKPIIFISYPSEDERLAQDLAKFIASDFLNYPRVFIASQLDPGQQWQDEIKEMLVRSAIVCVLRSEKEETRWVSMELGAAWAIGATVIPVCYGHQEISRLSDLLGARQAIHISDSSALERLYRTIARELHCDCPVVSEELRGSVKQFQDNYKPKSQTTVYAERQVSRKAEPYQDLQDGTKKIISPVTGTLVWEVPGRGKRPIPRSQVEAQKIPMDRDREAYCLFCPKCYEQTTPEISRISRISRHSDSRRKPSEKDSQPYVLHYPEKDEDITNILDGNAGFADFRRISNLFPIVTYDYWRRNYNFHPGEVLLKRLRNYVENHRGREHIAKIISRKPQDSTEEVDLELLQQSFFCGSHDLIVARRHFKDDARLDNERVGSGQLAADEHGAYFDITIDAVKDIFGNNEHVKYVAVFQNWLSPAGATLDHLHKQLVGIDEYGLPIERFIEARRRNPEFFNELLQTARKRNRILAQNDHAIAFVEEGRRYPTIAIYSKGESGCLKDHGPEQVKGMSDMVRACHAALPVDTPTNEEWYYTPRDSDIVVPWHVLILLRTSVQAGFEHATRIYINTYPSNLLVDRVTTKLDELLRKKQLEGIRVGGAADVQGIRLA